MFDLDSFLNHRGKLLSIQLFEIDQMHVSTPMLDSEGFNRIQQL
jgi:hypothetical protein